MSPSIAQLSALERAIQYKRNDSAWDALFTILQSIATHRTQRDGFFLPQLSDGEHDYLLTRLVTSIHTLIMDDGFSLSDAHYVALSVYQPTLDGIVYISPLVNGDHWVDALLHDGNGQRRNQLPGPLFNKLLLVLSVHSNMTLPLDSWFKHHREKMVLRGLSMINGVCHVDEQAEFQRNQWMAAMLALGDGRSIAPDIPLSPQLLSMAITAWMNVSYATQPHKNQVKRLLNGIFKQWTAPVMADWTMDWGLTSEQSPVMSTAMPTVMIVAEYFSSTHAMYRCFGPAIASLKSQFKLVLVSVDAVMDDASQSMFDDVVDLSTSHSDHLLHMLEGIRDAAGRVQPDIIFYPSLGMQPWSILAAQWRLAPIQLMAMGHPASSYCEAMDGVVVERDYVVNKALMHEPIIETPSGVFVFHQRADTPKLPVVERRYEKNQTVTIAIPAFVMKLNHEFMSALQSIAHQATRPGEFHFYPYVNGFGWRNVSKGIDRLLPNAVVHQPMAYGDYMASLSEHDMYVSTFPFGNTNGNLDAAMARLPAVVIRNGAMDVSGDFEMFRRLGLPEDWLVESLGDFVAQVLTLVNDPSQLQSAHQTMAALDYQQTFFRHESGQALLCDVFQTILDEKVAELTCS